MGDDDRRPRRQEKKRKVAHKGEKMNKECLHDEVNCVMLCSVCGKSYWSPREDNQCLGE